MLLDYIMYETHMRAKIEITMAPKSDMDMVNKEYADQSVKNIDPSLIKGVFNKEQFPNYKGDFVKDGNHDYVLVKNDKVTANTAYVIVKANKKGLVDGNSKVITKEMWGNIKFERVDRSTLPDTVEKLGITNAIPIDGTGVSKAGFFYDGNLKLAKRPIVFQDLDIDKASIDQYVRGDVIMLPLDKVTSIPGWTRISGALMPREGNEDIYKLLGDEYGMNFGKYGNGQPWRNFNNITQTPLPAKPIFASIPGRKDGLNIGGSAMFVTKNRAFTFGGHQGDYRKIVNNSFTCAIAGNGNLGGWTATGALPDPRSDARAVAFCNHVYLVGGTRSIPEGDKPIAILRAKLKEDGLLEKWETMTVRLPRSLCGPAVWVSGRRLYVAGGVIYTGKFGTDPKYGEYPERKANTYIYYANISSNGDIGPFKIANALNNPRVEASLIAKGKSLTMVAGWTDGFLDTNNATEDNLLGIGNWSKNTLKDNILPYTTCAVASGNDVHLFFDSGYKEGVKGNDSGITHAIATNNWDGKGLTDLRDVSSAYDDKQNRVNFDIIATSSKLVIVGGHLGSGTYTDPVPNTTVVRDCYMEYTGGKNDYLNYINGSLNLDDVPKGMFRLPYIPSERYMIDGKEVVYGFFMKN